jgi:ABC-type polysaccharide/polyol phosphate transport system ATPase subunit
MGVLAVNAIELNGVWVQYRRPDPVAGLRQRVADSLRQRKTGPHVITALCDFSIVVPRGARIGIAGPNGSGKSTLLAVMAGVLDPTRGTAFTYGKVTALLGSPGLGLDPNMTGSENIIALGVRLGETRRAMEVRMGDIRDFSGLASRLDHPVYTYSSGMNARLRFATITCISPDVLVIDEGIGTADLAFAERAAARMSEFANSAGTIVMASHNQQLLKLFCDELMWLQASDTSPGGATHGVVA